MIEVNEEKSYYYTHKVQTGTLVELKKLFHSKIGQMEEGLGYLGFILKPNNYRMMDWLWLLKKIERRISNWSYRFLSLGGRLSLVKEVLLSISGFWCSLIMLTKSILNIIRAKKINSCGHDLGMKESFIWSLGNNLLYLNP